MLTLFAAALAAAAPAAPAPATPAQPAEAHAQHSQMAMKDHECCCEEMMKKMHEGHKAGAMQDHQGHGATK